MQMLQCIEWQPIFYSSGSMVVSVSSNIKNFQLTDNA